MELLKLLSTNEIVAQTVCFLLLLVILRKFTWNKFLKLLDARKERIASDFRKIDTAKTEIERLKDSYGEKLARIEDEAREKIHAAVMEGRRASEEIRSRHRATRRNYLRKQKRASK
ncbi:MAG: ATP synthase F0 subunit B [Candidatus Omnitrophota bacterium]|jgi:F0F1-type ATP synthase membrane subunit b/b'